MNRSIRNIDFSGATLVHNYIIIQSQRKRKKRALRSIEETQQTLELYRSFKKDAVMPETSTAWKELGKLLGYQKKLQKQEG